MNKTYGPPNLFSIVTGIPVFVASIIPIYFRTVRNLSSDFATES